MFGGRSGRFFGEVGKRRRVVEPHGRRLALDLSGKDVKLLPAERVLDLGQAGSQVARALGLTRSRTSSASTGLSRLRE